MQAYNDWLIDEWAGVSSRFVPQCIVPIWPMEQTVAEIRRAVAKGHKGVIYPASPMELAQGAAYQRCGVRSALGGLPGSRCPAVFSFGGSPKIQMRPDRCFAPPVAAAFSSVVRSVSSIAVLANFLILTGVATFPDSQSCLCREFLGWGAYEIEYADYQSARRWLAGEGYPLKPSEFFNANVILLAGTIAMSLRVRHYPGTRQYFWSSNFPLANSTWPDTRQHYSACLAGLPEAEKRQIQWENAAKLYSL